MLYEYKGVNLSYPGYIIVTEDMLERDYKKYLKNQKPKSLEERIEELEKRVEDLESQFD